MTEPEYDVLTCITAGELRAQGIPVQGSVPDCGWVRRDAIVFGVDRAVVRDPAERGRMSIGIGVQFTEPFRWIEVEIGERPTDGLGEDGK